MLAQDTLCDVIQGSQESHQTRQFSPADKIQATHALHVHFRKASHDPKAIQLVKDACWMHYNEYKKYKKILADIAKDLAEDIEEPDQDPDFDTVNCMNEIMQNKIKKK